MEDGDSKGISGWEAWGRFWSRTRGVYEGGDKVPQRKGDQPYLVDEKAYLFFTVQYLKRELKNPNSSLVLVSSLCPVWSSCFPKTDLSWSLDLAFCFSAPGSSVPKMVYFGNSGQS